MNDDEALCLDELNSHNLWTVFSSRWTEPDWDKEDPFAARARKEMRGPPKITLHIYRTRINERGKEEDEEVDRLTCATYQECLSIAAYRARWGHI